MKQPTRFYPRLEVDTAPCASVAQAGGVMLTETIAVSGLAARLRTALAPWRKDLAVHDPAKVLLDLALTVALGGEHLSDVSGGPRGTRTHNLRIKSPQLCQLS